MLLFLQCFSYGYPLQSPFGKFRNSVSAPSSNPNPFLALFIFLFSIFFVNPVIFYRFLACSTFFCLTILSYHLLCLLSFTFCYLSLLFAFFVTLFGFSILNSYYSNLGFSCAAYWAEYSSILANCSMSSKSVNCLGSMPTA